MSDEKIEIPRKSVFIASPSGSMTFTIEYTRALGVTMTMLERLKLDAYLGFVGGCSIVDKARLITLEQFMRTGADCIFWIDSDIGWRPKDFLQFLAYPEPVVFGGYRVKNPNEYRIHADMFWEDGKPVWNERGDLIKCKGGPGGFMRVDRSVIEAIDEKALLKPVRLSDNSIVRDYLPIWREARTVADHMLPEWWTKNASEEGRNTISQHFGEDIMFCRLIRTAGIDIWCDPKINLTHSGHATFSGTVQELIDRPDLRPANWGPDQEDV